MTVITQATSDGFVYTNSISRLLNSVICKLNHTIYNELSEVVFLNSGNT